MRTALRNLIAQLYRYLYADYEECQKEGINDMVEEGLVLEMDIIEHNHKKELEQKEKEVTEKVTKEVTKEVTTYTACNMLRKRALGRISPGMHRAFTRGNTSVKRKSD